MSGDRFDWHEAIDWLLDQFVFSKIPEAQSKLAEAESKDGQEPTTETLRAEARLADARAEKEQPRALTSHDRKAIDKEFWDSM